MFGLVIGTIFSIIFLCGLANEKVSDAAYRARSNARRRAFEKSVDTNRRNEILDKIDKALFGDPWWPPKNVWDPDFSFKCKEKYVTCEMQETLFSSEMFAGIQSDLRNIFPSGVMELKPRYLRIVVLYLMLAKEGLIDENTYRTPGRIIRCQLGSERHSGMSWETADIFMRTVERLVREKNPNIRLCYQVDVKYSDLEWVQSTSRPPYGREWY